MRAYNAIIICTCILLLTGCNMPSASSPVTTSQVLPTATDTSIAPSIASPIAAYTATAEPTLEIVEPVLSTATPEVDPGECLVLLVPSEGVVYPLDKEIKFIWEAMPGAEKYLLEITNSTGWLLSIETVGTSYQVSAGMFPGAMNYSWTVAVFDSTGMKICRAGPLNFSITIKKSVPTEKPDKDGDGGPREGSGDGNDGGGWDDDSGDGGGNDDWPFPEW